MFDDSQAGKITKKKSVQPTSPVLRQTPLLSV